MTNSTPEIEIVEENTVPESITESTPEDVAVNETPEVPEVKVPKTISEVSEFFPLTSSSPKGITPISIFGELLENVDKAKDVTATLAANNQDLSEDEIVSIASQRSETEIKVVYAALEKARRAYDEKVKALLSAMDPILSSGKLSEDEKAAKVLEKKTYVEAIANFKGALEMLSHMIDPTEKDAFLSAVAEIKAPGMRGSGSVKTSGNTDSGYGKPRLNGGKVQISFDGDIKEYASIPTAAKAISDKTNSPVTGPDLLEAWCLSQGASNWKDVPMGITEFRFQSGIQVYIEKKVKKD